MASDKQLDPEMKGWLYKWTNYLKGYQKRWFVLANGLLSYYRTQAEMLHTCRGNISLHGASIHTEDSCNFVVSNGGTQTFHLKASSEVERQKWVTALELAKAKAVRIVDSEDDEEDDVNESPRDDVANTLRILTSKLEDLRTCHDIIVKHSAALQKSLAELEGLDPTTTMELPTKVKTANERATLFRISSNAMINTCGDFVDLSSTAGRKWVRLLHHEREQRIRLEEMVETLARQHSHLEEEAKEQMSHTIPSPNQVSVQSPSEDEEDNEFEDANEEFSEEIFLPLTSQHARSNSELSQEIVLDRDSSSSPDTTGSVTDHLIERECSPEVFYENLRPEFNLVSQSNVFYSSEVSEGAMGLENTSGSSSDIDGHPNTIQVIMRKEKSHTDSTLSEDMASVNGSQILTSVEGRGTTLQANGKPKRKRRIRVYDKPNYPINLWSIMKNCIGKELSKIPMPVNFSEPLSFLQRLTEDFEYSDILFKAAQMEDSCEQLAWVAAFTVSSYATTSVRTAKPFNPLLFETYECDRTDDLGWKAINEQVSHHPPIVAQHVDSRDWVSWQEFAMSSKFRGKYLQIIPLGIAHLVFHQSGNHYTWRKVSTTVHNMIVGKLWLDNHGEMEIVNHKTKDKCCLKFIPYSYFSRETPKKVTGYVVDSVGTFKWFLTGTWDERMEACRVTSQTVRHGKPVYETASPKVMWRRNWVNPESERYYNFTEFACQLNEPEEDVSPTDSRLRPDQRLMENGLWDEANSEKLRLEEKQRAARRLREAEVEQAKKEGREIPPLDPVWFRKEFDPVTNETIYRYKGGYWEAKEHQDWSMCPDIF